MTETCVELRAEGELLVGEIPAGRIGFTPRRVWNPSPSADHRTAAYDVPQRIEISTRVTAQSGAKFSPPPYAVVVEGDGDKALVAVAADAGWHVWNDVDFVSDSESVRAEIDLEGQSDPGEVMSHVVVHLIGGESGESWLDLLARGLKRLYPQAAAGPTEVAQWWLRPIYCGWGDQVAASMWLEGIGPEHRAVAYCIQGLYERWIQRLEQAQVPVGTVTVDAGWSLAGVWEPDPIKWPDLRGFVRRQHEAGRRVLLWLATWLWDGLCDEWCIFAGDIKLVADPTNPEYRAFIREKVQQLIAPDGCDADGFKVDQLSYCPTQRHPRGGPRFGWTCGYDPPKQKMQLAGDGWGCELLYQLQKEICDAAKSVKSDALITSSTVHPYFDDTFDMVRLHDVGLVTPELFGAMRARADVCRAVFPSKPIDADDWVHSDYDLWLRYTAEAPRLGVPCLLYAERFVNNWKEQPTTVPIAIEDLRKIARAWEREIG